MLTFQEKANHLDGAASLRRLQRKRILLCVQFTLRHIALHCYRYFTALRTVLNHLPLFGQLTDPEKQNRNNGRCREEAPSTACELAHLCVERSHLPGTKCIGYSLPWNKQCNTGQTTEVTGRKEREERVHRREELSTSTAVNSPKFHPSFWFPSFQK